MSLKCHIFGCNIYCHVRSHVIDVVVMLIVALKFTVYYHAYSVSLVT